MSRRLLRMGGLSSLELDCMLIRGLTRRGWLGVGIDRFGLIVLLLGASLRMRIRISGLKDRGAGYNNENSIQNIILWQLKNDLSE